MRLRNLVLIAPAMLLLVGTMLACSNADNDDDDGDDDAGDCHEVGVLFTAPEGVIDPWRALKTESCCGDGRQITIAEEMTDVECVLLEPLQFVCTEQNDDRVCDENEDFCSSPIDCAPPEGFAETCCQEGDFCWRSDYFELPPSGVLGCCAGLEELELDYYDVDLHECTDMYSESTIICVLDCGDGVCTAGENPCNCLEDCPADEW